MKKEEKARFALGLDFGTNSVRSLLAEVHTGEETASSVVNYPSGREGILLDPRDPNLARQAPADYIVSLTAAVRETMRKARRKGVSPAQVIGIGVDTTGSTPLPVDQDGVPLAFQAKFKKNLAAQAWLWKDHTSHEEAAMITAAAAKSGVPYLAKCGGTYSSEWFWSKIFHCLRHDPEVFAAAYSWVEAADFIPAYLTGELNPRKMKRSICAAGHKAMYHESWDGLPSKAFLRQLSPKLAELRDRLYEKAYASDQVAGYLTAGLAKKLGLPPGLPVAVGAFDAHLGAVGAGIKPGTLVKIIGTSTCDMLVSPLDQHLPDIPGVCGIVPHSIIPGMYGIEAGQSAVGDIFHWFVQHLCPPEYQKGDPHQNLSRAAGRLQPGESGLLALDWNNGNRTILVDPRLTGLLVGQTLHTTSPEIYRALIEATAFGALTIIRRLEEYGVRVKEVVTCGGIAEKNPLLMQIYADILNRPMKLSGQPQTCALGAAVCAAVVGGAYLNVPAAQKRMTRLHEQPFKPEPRRAKVYAKLYDLYQQLHDSFGLPFKQANLGMLMKQLIALREQVRGQR